MDFNRLFLFLIFSFSILLLWDAWQRSELPPVPVVAQVAPVVAPQAGVPVATISTTGATASAVVDPQKIQVGQRNRVGQQIIKVKTDYLTAEISTAGGDLHRLELVQHHDAVDKSKPFVLLREQAAHTYIAQTGLLGSGLPTHHALFTAQAGEYQMTKGKDTLEVRLSAMDVSGAKVSKVYVFHRGSYLIDVGYEIENTGASPLSPAAYFQLVRDKIPLEGESVFVPTYTGTAFYTEQDKFVKVDFSEIEEGKVKYPKSSDNGWIGMLQHYFVAAWLPKDKVQREFYAKPLDNELYSVGVILPVATIAPGQIAKISVPLYAGPALTSLDTIAPGFALTVDYGWLTVLSAPLFWVLAWLYGWVQNWGVAIILLTVLIKLVFFPLSAASYRSMGKMRVVAPKLAKLKEQYGDDRERMHKAMMELYKTEKINPLGGCLPVLIQIPVFIALYWAILATVELRGAPFFGWISDLSATDPYYVLPLIMGISMYIQMKLNPVPLDPLQAKLMQIMPVAFSVVFFFFPAGLVLYSVVNNILSIAQQWYITRGLEAEAKAKDAART